MHPAVKTILSIGLFGTSVVFAWSVAFGADDQLAVEEPIDLVAVGDAAAESKDAVSEIVAGATQAAEGEIETFVAFQSAGAELMTVLDEIDQKSKASVPLGETRPDYERAVLLMLRAQQMMRDGKIEVQPSDIVTLSAKFERWKRSTTRDLTQRSLQARRLANPSDRGVQRRGAPRRTRPGQIRLAGRIVAS